MNLGVVFLTGLTIGGLTCLAVQGGLLASIIASRREEQSPSPLSTIGPTVAFLVAKLASYTILGFILGAFGGAINISDRVQTYMQLAAGIYMILVAFNLLNLHPIFRYVIPTIPKFLARMLRKESHSTNWFAPAMLGALTIFIPCGTTIAMEALAISTANALSGALIMASFTLGTIPLFLGIGVLTSFLGNTFKTIFLNIAAVLVIYLGLTSAYGALVALGVANYTGPATTSSTEVKVDQNPVIEITSRGYSPNYLRVRKGKPVTIKLKNVNAYSCATAFRIPSLNIARNLLTNDTATITFTPQKTGKIPFSCSMGMYTGVIEVI